MRLKRFILENEMHPNGGGGERRTVGMRLKNGGYWKVYLHPLELSRSALSNTTCTPYFCL
jgi:hypothetical protein